ncbi:MAG: hypothetical protein FWF46_00770 [Oscillospiraceae bacterium]|nr:hypothetical protein [Oscillospiraceae bacterium]
MKIKNIEKIITKESYNENGKSIIELTNEWIVENYGKISKFCNKVDEGVKHV